MKSLLRPSRALLAISLLLPAVLFGLAGWRNYNDVLAETRSKVEKSVLISHEHTLKVFETHGLVIDNVNERLDGLDWKDPAQVAGLHELLSRLSRLPQIATIAVADQNGGMLSSSRAPGPDPSLNYADRDWFQALKDEDVGTYISKSYPGRQSGVMVFNVAARAHFSPGDRFDGIIAVSVDRTYFEKFFQSIEPEPGVDYNVVLFRQDGTVLARYPAGSGPSTLPPNGLVMPAIQHADSGTYTATSPADGIQRIFGYRKVGGFPVYIAMGVSTEKALTAWRGNLVSYGIVAALAALALLGVSAMALRESARERMASARWRDTAGRLEQEIERRAAAEQALLQAQKMDAIGQLTGGIAHDFNNMLTTIVGNLDLIVRRIGDDGDEKLRRWSMLALRGADRAATLTQRLLAFSRRQPLAPKSIDVDLLVAGMSDLLNSTLGEGVAIETVRGGGLWRALADPNQLESAIVNLAINARDAMGGGGKLTIETANIYLDEAYAALHSEVVPGQFVLIAVSDSGSGMTPEVLAHVFEPFFTTKPVGSGTGLGLAQVYGFVKQSGGHVKIYSEVDQGTTVKIYLPRAAEVAASPSLDSAGTVTGSRTETILVVEDDHDVRAYTTDILRQLGHIVLEAAEGTGALGLIDARPDISLLFTDVGLPGMNGRQLADEAKRRRPDLKVLFTTGYARNAIVHHGRLDPGVELITKPFGIDALASKIRSILEADAA